MQDGRQTELASLILAIGAFLAQKIIGEILHNDGTICQLELMVGTAYAPDLTTVADYVLAQVELYQTIMGVLNNNSFPGHIDPQAGVILEASGRFKKAWPEPFEGFVQQGRSRFCAKSVRPVREHGKMARTPLAAFFNSPMMEEFRTAGVQILPPEGDLDA